MKLYFTLNLCDRLDYLVIRILVFILIMPVLIGTKKDFGPLLVLPVN